MKNILKSTILVLLLSIMLISFILPIVSNADYKSEMKTLISDQDSSEAWKDKSTASGKVNNVMNAIVIIVRIAGMCIAVTMLLVLAMKYMMAAPGEKADIKKSSTAYIVGALVLFGAVGILGIISNFASGNIKVSAPTSGT